MLSEPCTCQIVRFKPRFDTFLQDMIINFNFLGYCICEMQIKLGNGNLSRGYDEQHFVYEVLRSLDQKSTFLVGEIIAKRIKELNSAGLIKADKLISDDSWNKESYPMSLQAALEAEGIDYKNFYDH
jgi:hypothetical protein